MNYHFNFVSLEDIKKSMYKDLCEIKIPQTGMFYKFLISNNRES